MDASDYSHTPSFYSNIDLNSFKSDIIWTNQQDQLLRSLFKLYPYDWNQISSQFKNRTSHQCTQRYKILYDITAKVKRNWTKNEDLQLENLIQKYCFEWKQISKFFQNCNEANCFSRYQQLKFSSKAVWNTQLDSILLQLFLKYPFDWVQIANHLQRSQKSCIARYRVLKGINSKQLEKIWSQRQDQILVNLVESNNLQYEWNNISKKFSNCNGANCFFRYKQLKYPSKAENIWVQQELNLLLKIFKEYPYDWDKISTYFNNKRTKQSCYQKYKKIANVKVPPMNRQWTQKQDELLIKFTEQFNYDWSIIKTKFKKCNQNNCFVRYRQLKYSSSQLKKSLSIQEDKLLIQLFDKYPYQWQKIASYFPKRCKWNCYSRYRVLKNISMKQFNRNWTLEQDNKLIQLIGKQKFNWNKIAENFITCNGANCFLRYKQIRIKKQHIQQVKNLDIKQQEIQSIIDLFKTHPYDWKSIAEIIQQPKSDCQYNYKIAAGIDKNNSQRQWKPQQDAQLIMFVQIDYLYNWNKIAQNFTDCYGYNCYKRYGELINCSLDWITQDDQLLLNLFEQYLYDWKQTSNHLIDRNEYCCENRYKKLNRIDHQLITRTWTSEETQILIRLIEEQGYNWNQLALYFQNCNGRSCFQKYKQCIELKLKEWTRQQDQKLASQFIVSPYNWIHIANQLSKPPFICYYRYKAINKLNIKAKQRIWNQNQDNLLKRLVYKHLFDWNKVQKYLINCNALNCYIRFRELIHQHICPWTQKQNMLLIKLGIFKSNMVSISIGNYFPMRSVNSVVTQLRCLEIQTLKNNNEMSKKDDLCMIYNKWIGVVLEELQWLIKINQFKQ